MKIRKAVAVGSVTLVSHFGPFPRKRGNCFDAICRGGRTSLRIVNFNHENLQYLFELGTISWPIKVLQIGERTGLIYDPRVPIEFFDKEWCAICCPERLLPMPQRIERRMRMAKGEITVRRVTREDGSLLVMRYESAHSPYTVDGGWKTDAVRKRTGPSVTFADYIPVVKAL